MNNTEGHSRSSELPLYDRPYITSYYNYLYSPPYVSHVTVVTNVQPLQPALDSGHQIPVVVDEPVA